MVLAVVHAALMLFAQARTLGFGLTVAEQHHWRQSFTFGVAWNFAHTSWDFFHPRMLLHVSGSNVVGMEAPVYPYLCAPLLRLFSDSVMPCRLVTWSALVVLLTSITIGFFPGRPWARAGFLVAAGVSPLAWSEFRQVQPDGMMVAFASLAALFFIRHARNDSRRDLWIGAGLTTLAVMTKSAALGILPALMAFAVWGSRRRSELRFIARTLFSFAPALTAWIAWDRWAAHLLHVYSKDVIVISVQHDPAQMLANVKNVGFLHELVTFLVANYACSWWLLPAVFVGVVDALSTAQKRAVGVPTAIWLAGVLLMLLCFGDRLHSNWYYATPIFPPLAIFAGIGLASAAEALEGVVVDRARRFALLALAPSLPLGWILARPLAGSIDPGQLAIRLNQSIWGDALGFASIALIVCIAAGLASSTRARHLPSWLAGAAVAMMFAALALPRAAAAQTLAYFAGAPEREKYVAELASLRRSIDRISRPRDRIVVDNTEIVYLAMARRNGWSDGATAVRGTLEDHVAHGARLFVHYGSEAPPPVVAGHPVLARGKTWSIHCIAVDQCPEAR